MSGPQTASLVRLLKHLLKFDGSGAPEFWHGNCIGADDEAAALATKIGYTTRAWPGDIVEKRGEFVSTIVHEWQPNLTRNRIIAGAVEPLIACPKEDEMVVRSGTWATVRYARQDSKTVYVIAPSGRIDKEWVEKIPGRLVERRHAADIDLRKDRL